MYAMGTSRVTGPKGRRLAGAYQRTLDRERPVGLERALVGLGQIDYLFLNANLQRTILVPWRLLAFR